MSCKTFEKFIQLLADDLIFESQGTKPQQHVKVQFAAFLLHYGNHGSNAFHLTRNLGIGEGTVYTYCQRVSKAVCKLHNQFLGWPDEARKTEISQFLENQSGFCLCLGSGDGSLFQFTKEPMVNGDQYCC